jgi:hypothetical protein
VTAENACVRDGAFSSKKVEDDCLLTDESKFGNQGTQTNMPQWTTVTPDGRRIIVNRHQDGWTVACNDNEFAPRDRLDVALIEAILLDDDFALHTLRFDYAAWSAELAEQIQHGQRPPDQNKPGESASGPDGSAST